MTVWSWWWLKIWNHWRNVQNASGTFRVKVPLALFVSFPPHSPESFFQNSSHQPFQLPGLTVVAGGGIQDGFTCSLSKWSFVHMAATYAAWSLMGYGPVPGTRIHNLFYIHTEINKELNWFLFNFALHISFYQLLFYYSSLLEGLFFTHISLFIISNKDLY